MLELSPDLGRRLAVPAVLRKLEIDPERAHRPAHLVADVDAVGELAAEMLTWAEAGSTSTACLRGVAASRARRRLRRAPPAGGRRSARR